MYISTNIYDYLLLVTSYCNERGLRKLPAGTIIWGVSLVQVPRNNDRDTEVPEIQNRTLKRVYIVLKDMLNININHTLDWEEFLIEMQLHCNFVYFIIYRIFLKFRLFQLLYCVSIHSLQFNEIQQVYLPIVRIYCK